MGSIKKLAEWLSGDYKTEEQTTSPLIKIKVFNKRLARQINKMEIKEKVERRKAIEARRTGDILGSKVFMKNSLQYRKWGYSSEKFRLQIENIQFQLEQAKIMGQFTKVAEDISSTLQGLQSNVSMPEISKLLKNIDFGFETMETISEEATSNLEMQEENSPSGVSDDEVENALAELDAEMSAGSAFELPSVPFAETSEDEIDELQDEIQKLKQKQKN